MTNRNKCDTIDSNDLTKAQKAFLEYCKDIGWGKLEVIVKDGEPVMITASLSNVKLD